MLAWVLLPVLISWNASDQLHVLGLAAAALMHEPPDQITNAPMAMARDRQVRFVQAALLPTGRALQAEIPAGE